MNRSNMRRQGISPIVGRKLEAVSYIRDALNGMEAEAVVEAAGDKQTNLIARDDRSLWCFRPFGPGSIVQVGHIVDELVVMGGEIIV